MTQFTDQNLVARNLPLRFQGGADNEGHGMTNGFFPYPPCCSNMAKAPGW